MCALAFIGVVGGKGRGRERGLYDLRKKRERREEREGRRTIGEGEGGGEGENWRRSKPNTAEGRRNDARNTAAQNARSLSQSREIAKDNSK
jgi:hypothetical protein